MPPDSSDDGRLPRGGLGDRIANKALLFVLLTGLGVAVYALCFAVLGPNIPIHSAMAVLVGGILAAVLLIARDTAQRGVDWLLYGDREDPERALLRVGRQVESAGDDAVLVDALAGTSRPRCGCPTSRSCWTTGRRAAARGSRSAGSPSSSSCTRAAGSGRCGPGGAARR